MTNWAEHRKVLPLWLWIWTKMWEEALNTRHAIIRFSKLNERGFVLASPSGAGSLCLFIVPPGWTDAGDAGWWWWHLFAIRESTCSVFNSDPDLHSSPDCFNVILIAGILVLGKFLVQSFLFLFFGSPAWTPPSAPSSACGAERDPSLH